MKSSIYILVSGGLTMLLVPIILPLLRKFKFGQFVREDGPKEHLKKSGTPTMGGIIFLSVIGVGTLLVGRDEPQVIAVLLTTLSFGLIGFIDDYIKVGMKRSLGFRAYQKLLAQILVALAFCLYIYQISGQDTSVIIPFIQKGEVQLGWLYLPFLMVVMLGTVNGVNLTDGIDGLSTSITIAVLGYFLIIDQLLATGMLPILAISIGALLGFLLYNAHPASVFMGDTGSLALGGLVASVAIYMRLPLIILVVGLIYLIEVLSVIVQVGYFKKTGKRFFKMAPIHHHFELLGWKETKVVYVFTIITLFLSCIGYIGVVLYLG